jgi:hypothetical protein
MSRTHIEPAQVGRRTMVLGVVALFARAVPGAAGGADSTDATHAARGVVTAVDAASIVIARGRSGLPLACAVNESTIRTGAVQVGSHVSIRYRRQGGTFLATAITVHPARK